MAQDRLRRLLAAAVEAAEAHPDWRAGDELAVIAADDEATVMTTRGFGSEGLVACLEVIAGNVRAGTALGARSVPVASGPGPGGLDPPQPPRPPEPG